MVKAIPDHHWKTAIFKTENNSPTISSSGAQKTVPAEEHVVQDNFRRVKWTEDLTATDSTISKKLSQ